MASKNPKLIDITQTAKASPNSRSIIVNHNPIMHDPTLNEPKTTKISDAKEENLSAEVNKQIKIEPPEEDKVKTEDKDQAKAEPPAEKIEDKAEAAPADADNTKPSGEVHEEPDKAGKDESVANETESATATDTSTSTKSSEDELKQQQEKENEAIAQHLAAVTELTTSRRYFLPINMKEKKKNRKVVAIGIVVALLLTVVWFDVALDAGIISNSFNLPHTHFFKLKS